MHLKNPIELSVFIYDEESSKTSQLIGKEEKLEDMIQQIVTFYSIDNVTEHPLEGDGAYSIVMSGGGNYIADKPIDKVKSLIKIANQ